MSGNRIETLNATCGACGNKLTKRGVSISCEACEERATDDLGLESLSDIPDNTHPNYYTGMSRDRLIDEHKWMLENLTATQARCTELTQMYRDLKAKHLGETRLDPYPNGKL